MPVATMPSGLQFEFREMKVSDEDAIAEAEASGDPKQKDTAQERACRNCWAKTIEHGPYKNRLTGGQLDMMELLVGDVAYYMMQLYRESRGDKITVAVPCPEGHRQMVELDLSDLEIYSLSEKSQKMFLADEPYKFTLPRNGREVTFGLMTWRMQKALTDSMQHVPKALSTELMAARVRSIEGFDDHDLDPKTNQDKRAFIASLPSFDANALRDEILSVECGIETLIDLRCTQVGCGRVVPVELDEGGSGSFFESRRHRRRSSRK